MIQAASLVLNIVNLPQRTMDKLERQVLLVCPDFQLWFVSLEWKDWRP